MLTQATRIGQLEVTPACLQVLLHFVVLNGDVELSKSNHRTNIPYDVDPLKQMAFVNSHIEQMGQIPLSEDDINKIIAVFNTAKEIS